MTLGMLLMTVAAVESSWVVLMPGMLIAMIGTGMFNPAVIAVALGSVSDGQSGLAAGVNDTFRQGGIAVGVGALAAAYLIRPSIRGKRDRVEETATALMAEAA